MFSSGKRCCIREKMVVIGQQWLFFGNVVVFGQIIFLFWQGGCIRESGRIRAKVVVFGKQCGFFGQKWLYSGKVVVFLKKCVFRA